jgi:hypothetical protein
MATDVKLDQIDGTFVVVQGRVLKVEASDLILDSPDRHHGGGPHRRAMVHDQSDGLTINFNSDYPGGVAINGNKIHLRGPEGARLSIDQTGVIGATTNADQVTLHGTIINLDTTSADSLSAGEIRITFQNPDELDQNGNPVAPGFMETLSLGSLLTQLRNEIQSLKDRIAHLEAK